MIKKKEQEEFSRKFGLEIERISWNFLNENKGIQEVCNEFIFGNSKLKSADLHIYFETNLSIVQIKNKRLTLRASTGNYNSYLADFEKSIMRSIEQSIKLLNNPIYINELKLKFSTDKFSKIYILNLNPDEYVIDHYPSLNNKIHDYIRKNLTNSAIKDIPYIVTNMSLSSFFLLTEIAKENRITIAHLIEKYASYRTEIENSENYLINGLPDNIEHFMRNSEYFKKTQFHYSKKLYELIKQNVYDEIRMRFNFE